MERSHRRRGETILNPENVARMLSGLQLFPFFPQSGEAFDALVRMVGNMAETEDQVRWLVDRMLLNPYPKWPGPAEMRAVFCTRFKPKDGYSIAGSVVSPGEIVPNQLNKAEPEYKKLERGEPVSEDLTLDASISALGELKDINRVTRPRRVPAIPVTEGRITQADIDRAVEENRDKRARRELGQEERDGGIL